MEANVCISNMLPEHTNSALLWSKSYERTAFCCQHFSWRGIHCFKRKPFQPVLCLNQNFLLHDFYHWYWSSLSRIKLWDLSSLWPKTQLEKCAPSSIFCHRKLYSKFVCCPVFAKLVFQHMRLYQLFLGRYELMSIHSKQGNGNEPKKQLCPNLALWASKVLELSNWSVGISKAIVFL